MEKVGHEISGYSYGEAEVGRSSVTVQQLDELKVSCGFEQEDERYLQLAGAVLADQTKEIVDHWRSGIIAGIPRLARHSRTLEGDAIPDYLAKSNLRFRQWIIDTCLRPYDQNWIDYQQEIALRHTAAKKNTVDGVRSTPHVPLRDIIAFIAIMNQTIKQYLAAKGHSSKDVDKMHDAWCKSIQLQLSLWIGPYSDTRRTPMEW